jgi:hypothetical protein
MLIWIQTLLHLVLDHLFLAHLVLDLLAGNVSSPNEAIELGET